MATLNNVIANANGNVGIGTTNPTAKLTIVDNTNGGSINLVGRTNDDTAAINFRANGDASTYAYVAPDTNEFRLYHNDGFMSFYPGGSEKVRITSTGNIGIGTTSVPTRLTSYVGAGAIAGTNDAIRLQVSSYDNAARNTIVWGQDSGGSIVLARYGLEWNSSAGQMNFVWRDMYNGGVGSTELMRFTAAGNLGIGTTSPTGTYGKLSVAGGIRILDDSNAKLEIGRYSSGASNSYIKLGSNSNSLRISNNTDAADIFTIENGGNVGIGTTSPNKPLDVVATSGANALQIRNRSDNDYGFIIFNNYAGSETSIAQIGAYRTGVNQGSLLIYTGTTEKVRINNDGNVGIGTSSPSATLNVRYDNAGASTVALFENRRSVAGSPDDGQIVVGSRGYNNTILRQNSDQGTNAIGSTLDTVLANTYSLSGYGKLILATQSTARLTIDTAGNVGIGTTSPTTKLAVSDGTTIAQVNPSSGVAYFGTVNNYPMALSVNSSEKVRIFSGGSVSFGTSTDTLFSAGNIYLNGATGTAAGPVIGFGQSDSVTGGIGHRARITGGGTSQDIFIQSQGASNSIGLNANPSGAIIYFQTQGTEKVRIAADGNVGIGTSSPGSKLHVVGAVYGTTSGQFGTAVANGANASFAVFGGNSTSVGVKLVLDSDVNRNDLVVTATSGNIGIGTNSAAYKLDVSTSIVSRSNISTPRFSSAGGYVYGITNSPSWNQSCGTYTNNNATAPDGTTSAGTYTLTSTCGSYDVYQTISSLTVGRVYTIGMWVKLGTATNFCLVVNNTQAWNSIGGKAFTSSDGLSTSKWTHISFTFTAIAPGNINLHLGYHAESAVTQQTAGTVFLWNIEMTEFSSTWIGNVEDEIRLPGSSIWTSRGNVGIGTTSPSSAASFNKVVEAYDATSLSYQVNSGGTYKAEFGISSAGGWLGTSTTHDMRLVSNGTERMRILSGGSIGIGTTSPGYKLQVNSGGIAYLAAQGNALVMGDDATYGASGTGRYVALGYGGLSNGANKIFAHNTGEDGLYICSATSRNISFRPGGGATDYVVITSVGNVGIGTSTVGAPLTIYRASNPHMRINGGGDVSYIQLDDGTSTGYLIKNVSAGTGNGALAGALYTYTDSNKAFQHIHSGTPLFTILSGGSVGIGSTAPNDKLDVVGRVYAYRYIAVSSNATSPAYATDTSSGMFNAGSNIIGFSISGAEKVRIDAGGNLGVGITSLVHKIQAAGLISAGDATYNNNSTFIGAILNNDQTNPGLDLRRWNGGGAGTDNHGATYIATNSAGDTLFYNGLIAANTRATNEKMRISVAGNVGIGTTSPSAKLNISLAGVVANTLSLINVSSWGNNTVQLFNSNGGTTGNEVLLLGCQAGGNGQLASGFGFGRESSATWGTYISLKTHSPSTSVIDELYERVRITADGNVGIGTTSPSAPLAIYRASDPYMRINGGGNYSYIQLDDGTSTGYLIKNVSAGTGNGALAGALYTYTDSGKAFQHIHSGTPLFTILSGGNVGIGTTSPADKLEIEGGIRLRTGGGITLRNATNDSSAAIYNAGGGGGSLIYLAVGPSPTMTIGTNVGIGTTSPTSLLHLAGVGGDGVAFLRIAGTASDAFNWGSSVMYANLAATETAINLIGKAQSQYNCSYIGYRHVADGSALNMLSLGLYAADHLVNILGNGNVGIGTSSPVRKLHIYGPQSVIALSNTGTGAWSGLQWSVGNGAYTAYSGLLDDTGRYFIDVGSNGDDFTILQNGNVGIGTTSPVAKLDVNGTSNFAANTYHSIGGQKFFAGSGGTYAYIYTGTTALNFINGNDTSTLMTLLNGGNVGIGTTSPNAKLDVNGSIYLNGNIRNVWGDNLFNVTQYPNNTSTSPSYYMGFQADANNRIFYISNKDDDGSATDPNGGIIFRTGGTPTNRMLISYTGNVGIGTTSPNTLLNVHGANPFVRISNTVGTDHGIKISYGNSDTHGLHLLYNANSALSYIDNTYPIDAAQVWGDILFRQNVASTMTTRMIIKANSGNVGIGTTGPSARLHVFDTNNSPATGNLLVTSTGGNASIRIDSNSTANYTYFTLSQGGVGKVEMGIVPTSSDFYINPTVQSGANGAAIYIKKADGNVGLGTTSPVSKLDITSTNDQILTLNKSSGTAWNYIGFSQAGTRRFYFGLNASFEPELGVDNGGTFRVLGGMTVAGNAVLTTTSTLTAGNLSGTIPSGVLGNSTNYVGTTAIALNRASASQTLTGVSIDGNSGNVSGTVAIANGGTGATSAAAARTNLGIANNYLYAKRTTNQTIASGTWANRDIIFNINSASSGIAYDTSTGVASLTGGKVYRITALLSWSRSSAFSTIWSLFNNADNSQLGPDVYNDSVTYTINQFVNPTLDMILAPTSSIDVKIRTSSNMSVYDSSLFVQGTNVCLIIQQIA